MNFLKFQNTRLIILSISIFTVIYVLNFYVCDDAFYSFRSIDNLLSGHYFSYNPNERVQAFTNPLWTIIVGLVKFILYGPGMDPDPYWLVTFWLSLLFCIISLLVILKMIEISVDKATVKLIVCLTILILSKSFIDFTSSGLEYPISYLLIAVFYYFYYYKYDNKNFMMILTIIFSLSFVNRIDSVILMFLPLLYVAWRNIKNYRFKKTIIPIFFGLLPILLWEIFSIIYYGFFLPNTYYAKLNIVASPIVWLTGVRYLLTATLEDPVTMCIIVISIFSGLFNDFKYKIVSCSIVIALLYIVSSGGDFMGSRFFSLPFLVGFLLIVVTGFKKNYYWWTLLFIFICFQMLPHSAVNTTRAFFKPLDIERRSALIRFINSNTNLALWTMNWDKNYYYYASTVRGRYVRAHAEDILPTTFRFPYQRFHSVDSREECFGLQKTSQYVEIGMGGGLHAYCKGLDAEIVDQLALGDALISRLPVADKNSFTPGHNARISPLGYRESLIANDALIEDPQINAYYKKLNLLTRSSSYFSLKRWEAIYYLNFIESKYDSNINHIYN